MQYLRLSLKKEKNNKEKNNQKESQEEKEIIYPREEPALSEVERVFNGDPEVIISNTDANRSREYTVLIYPLAPYCAR